MFNEEEYPVNSKDLHGAYVRTRDKTALLTSQVQMTFLLSTVKSPPADTVWRAPTIADQTNEYTVKMLGLVGPGTLWPLTIGRYRAWFRITDSPEESLVASADTFRIV